MSKRKTSRTRRTRRKRRQAKSKLSSGKNPAKHACKTGRTGQIREKKNHSPKLFKYSTKIDSATPKSISLLLETIKKPGAA